MQDQGTENNQDEECSFMYICKSMQDKGLVLGCKGYYGMTYSQVQLPKEISCYIAPLLEG